MPAKNLLNIRIILAFVLIVCVGTVIHELGHFIVAWVLDLNPELHYAQCDWSEERMTNEARKLSLLGGILLPTIIGFGSLLRLSLGKWNDSSSWFYAVLSTLPFRAFLIFSFFLLHTLRIMKTYHRSDEVKLNVLFKLPNGSFETMFLLLGLLSVFVIWRKLQKNNKRPLVFFINMAIGVAIGYPLWFLVLGPWLLP